MSLEQDLKQKSFGSEQEKVVVNIFFTYHWLNNLSREFFKKYNITAQQYNVLRILRGQHPKPSSINTLKERMLDRECDASRLVVRLKSKGLLERKICENDKRAVDISITKKGLDLLSKIDKELPERNSKLTANLSLAELRQLNFLLDKIRG
ncbi:MAG: MarR family transcriptional regulator [Cytophagaceae bacterium]|nr:MarR family transcriptional regulator [Cytophagaceae bacterium]MDW8457418.1 MarR family transcriptional regulator [Cytophagaceae bacterium]